MMVSLNPKDHFSPGLHLQFADVLREERVMIHHLGGSPVDIRSLEWITEKIADILEDDYENFDRDAFMERANPEGA